MRRRFVMIPPMTALSVDAPPQEGYGKTFLVGGGRSPKALRCSGAPLRGPKSNTHLAVAVHRCFRPADPTHTARPNGFCSNPRRSEPSSGVPPRAVARLLFEPEARFLSARRVRRALGGASSAGYRTMCVRRSDRGGLSFGDFSLAVQRKVTCRGSATHK